MGGEKKSGKISFKKVKCSCKRVPVSIYNLSVSITVTAAVSGLACFTESRLGAQPWVRPQRRPNQSGAPVAGDRGGTAGPKASRTAKCFSEYKNKTQF